MKKTILVSIVSLALLIALFGCTTQTNANLEDTSVRLPIPFYNAFFAGFTSAQDYNFYADEGLEVVYNLGSPELNPVKMVSAGKDDFGILGGPDTLVVARSKGEPLVAIAVIHHDVTFPVLATLKESNITKPSDLEGKKIGLFYGHISTETFRYFLGKEGINYEEVNIGGDVLTPLVSGNVDAAWNFSTGIVDFNDKGIEVNFIRPDEYGVLADGYVIFTREELIENNPDKVERFLRATIKGIEFSINSEDEAINSVLKRNGVLKFHIEKERLAIINSTIDTEKSEELGIGYIEPAIFERAYERMQTQGLLENEFDVSEAYTTQFLDSLNFN